MNHLSYSLDRCLQAAPGALKKQPLQSIRVFALIVGIAIAFFSGWAIADPPARVGRLGYMTGAVSFSPAGENDWVRASINRPLTTGDRLWTDERARTEVQIGGAMVRMGADTSLAILNLSDRIAQLQLTQGTLNVRVRRLGPGQVFEVDTPNLAFTLRQVGEYRITVDPDGIATTIIVRKGRGEAYGEGAAYVVDARQPYRFTGTGLREYSYVTAPRLDEFDRWSTERDRRYDNSGSARYVSQDVIGYQDLDAYGTWRADAAYGNVWRPNRVSSGWAPYRDGHWAWVDPWGWTWIDDAPWGFAVSHYGRWAYLGGAWAWIPGPVRSQAYYAPALVVFVGGNNFQLAISSGSVGGVGWFPLGPREVYQPSYTVSRGYFQNINASNIVVNSTVINNYYNNSNITNIAYANREVAGAIIAVPTTAFVQSQPVSKAAIRVTRDMVSRVTLSLAAPIAPTERSVHGDAAAGNKPPAKVFERPVVARTAPPAAHPGFAAQQTQLTAKPGKPLEEAVRKDLKPAAATPAPTVKVVAQAQAGPPNLQPPPTAPNAKPADARGKPEQPGNRAQRDQPAVASSPAQRGNAPAPSAAPQQAAPPVQPAQPRGRSEQRGNSGQREEPAAPAARVMPPQRTNEPKAVAPPAQAPAPAPTAQQPARPERNPAPAARRAEPPPPPPQAPEAVRQPAPLQAQPGPNAETRGQEARPRPNADKRKDQANDKATRGNEEQLPEEEPRGRKK